MNTQAQILDTTEEAYRLDPAVSTSDIGLFIQSPLKYYKAKFEGGDGITSSGFRTGSAFDVFFLTPDQFDDLYVVQPEFEATPSSSSTQQQTFCEILTANPEMNHVEAYRLCGYKLDGKKDEAVEKAADALFSDLKQYISFMRTVKGRVVLFQKDKDELVLMRQAIENHPRGVDFEEAPNGVTVFNQIKIRWTETVPYPWSEEGTREVACKGMIDRMIILPEEKLVKIYDVKTTAKPWPAFYRYIPIYGYDKQAVMYTKAVRALLEAAHGIDETAEWTIEYRLMVVQTNGLFEARSILIPDFAIEVLEHTVNAYLTEIQWHTLHNKWAMTREAYDNFGDETYVPDEIYEDEDNE